MRAGPHGLTEKSDEPSFLVGFAAWLVLRASDFFKRVSAGICVWRPGGASTGIRRSRALHRGRRRVV